MSKFGEAMRGLTVFISDIRNCDHLWIREREREREAAFTCHIFPCTFVPFQVLCLILEKDREEGREEREGWGYREIDRDRDRESL